MRMHLVVISTNCNDKNTTKGGIVYYRIMTNNCIDKKKQKCFCTWRGVANNMISWKCIFRKKNLCMQYHTYLFVGK